MRSHEVCIFLVHFEAKDSPGCTKLKATFRRDAILTSTTLGFYLVTGAESVYTAELEENFGPITLRHTSARLKKTRQKRFFVRLITAWSCRHSIVVAFVSLGLGIGLPTLTLIPSLATSPKAVGGKPGVKDIVIH